MKISFKILTTFALLSLCVLSSCKKGESMSEKRAKERKSIEKYISNNEIQVIKADSIPDDAVFGEKDYYLLPSGLYIQIVEKGTGEKPEVGDNVLFRYCTFSLEDSRKIADPTSANLTNAVEFKYGSGLYCAIENDYDNNNYSFHSYYVLNDLYVIRGIQEAIGYLRYDGAASLIIPSAIGSANAQDYVQAYRYEIRNIKIY